MRSGFFGATVIVTAMVLLPSQAQAVSQDEAAHTCTAAKLKAIAKNAASKLKCEANAFKKQAVLDADCLSKADTKLQDAFTKAELKGGCNSAGDAGSVQSKVDNFVYDVVVAQKTFPTCDNPGGSCGHCGDGVCGQHGDGYVCISNSSFTNPGCASDAECISPPDQLCVTGTSTSACVSPCP